MTFKVIILGSGSAMPAPGRHHSAHAINVHEQFYLVDCGESTQSQLLKYGINPMKIRAIFITHLHGDHIFGLFPLISTLGLMGRKVPLDVYAPYPIKHIAESYNRYFDPEPRFEVRYHEIDTTATDVIYSNKVMEVSTVPMRHRVPAAGFIFREKQPALNIRKDAIIRYELGIAQIVAAKRGEDICLGDGTMINNADLTYAPYIPRSYAYCSDTLYSGKVASLVKGVDLLYHEATFADTDRTLAKQTGHTTATQAARIAKNAGVGRLLIGHFSGRYKEVKELLVEAREIFPTTYCANEGDCFEINVKTCVDSK